MTTQEHQAFWDKINSNPPQNLKASANAGTKEEWFRLKGHHEAKLHKPEADKGASFAKRFIKGKAKGVGQILKATRIISISADNPPIKGHYKTIPIIEREAKEPEEPTTSISQFNTKVKIKKPKKHGIWKPTILKDNYPRSELKLIN